VLELESIRISATLLSIVSGILLICVFWTEWGRAKGFAFLTGGFCMITTIVSSFRVALDSTKFSCAMVIVWFILTLMIFAFTTWLAEE